MASFVGDPLNNLWRDAFQCSPCATGGMSDEMLQRLMDLMKLPPDMAEQMKAQHVTGTMRYRIRLSVTGSKVRIRFSNEEGNIPLLLAGGSMARAGDGFNAVPGTLRHLTFGGNPGILIPAGAPVLSDPLDLPVQCGDEFLISIYSPHEILLQPELGGAMIAAPGDQTGAYSLEDPRQMAGRPLISGASVLAADLPNIVVTLGDSITDGVRAMASGIRGWPEQLDRRLASRAAGGTYCVLNAGIGGNRLLSGGWGASGLGRLDRDVLRIDGATHLILLEGTNDLGMAGDTFFGKNPSVSSADIISGYRQIIARTQQRSITVIIGTITPRAGSMDFSEDKETIRKAVNDWIRNSGEPDAFIDFDLITRDPACPDRLLPKFDSGDHLHLSDEGYVAMGDGVPLELFR